MIMRVAKDGEVDEKFRQIWRRYENLKFIMIIAVIGIIIGSVLTVVFPPVGVAVELVSWVVIGVFAARFVNAVCPECQDHFTTWSSLFLGHIEPRNCRHCDTSAGKNPFA